GGDILQGIRQFPVFEQVARYHHERYDGSGYPEGLKMEQIPYPARIVAICDAFDAMTSDRSYRSALSDEVAISELVKNKGIQFDPYLVDAFLSLCGRYSDSLRQHVDELAALTATPQEENEEKPKQS
ncbi:MAG: HD domain-containing protein, partial [Bacilli bacterium]|nr:HD domain-containing protein [Bacilli bacterium]